MPRQFVQNKFVQEFVAVSLFITKLDIKKEKNFLQIP